MKALHQLIKSLGKAEKRYFKVFSSRHIIHGSRHDIELFDAIHALEKYDETTLLKQIKTTSLAKNLNVYKHLLYKHLLKVLNTYHCDDDIENIVWNNYLHAKLLMHKGLYAESLKFCQQAFRLATEANLHHMALMISEWQFFLEAKVFRAECYKENVLKKAPRLIQFTQYLQTEWQYKYAHAVTFYTTKERGVRDILLNQQILKSLEQQVKKIPTPTTPKSKLLLTEIHATIAFLKGEYEKSVALEYEVKSLLNKVYSVREMYCDELLSCYMRMAASYHMMGDLKSMKSVLKEVEKIPILNNNILITKNKLFINFELIHYINFGITSKADEMLEKVQILFGMDAENYSLEQFVITYQNLAIYLFICEAFEEAMKTVHKILKYSSRKIAIDIIISAKMLELATLFELKNYQDLKAKCGSAKRYILKYRELNPFEQAFFACIRYVTKRPSEKRISEALNTLYSQLKNIDDIYHKTVFPYSLWIESKVQKRPFAKILADNVYLIAAP